MPAEQPSTLSPLALSILGLEQAGFLPATGRNAQTSSEARERPTRQAPDRRVASYFNHFQSRCAPSTDSPPCYAAAASANPRIPIASRYLDNGKEILPRYTCSVHKEGPLYMLLESCSPFTILPRQEWREVYVVLRGTQLSIHRVKSKSLGKHVFSSAGKLLRKYTLQHAEAGIAVDVSHSVLIPVTRMASLIPSIARRKAFEKDPDLFRVEKQYSLRMRAELDQFVLSGPSEEQVFSWVNHICAGIDIAPAIDERNVPKQCTMPRRRRRNRPFATSDISDQSFIAEQQQILQAMYPAFAEPQTAGSTAADQSVPVADEEFPMPESASPDHAHNSSPIITVSLVNEQEQEDIDLSEIAEDAPTPLQPTMSLDRPGASRRTTASSVMTLSTFERLASNTINFALDGKWAPPHPQTAAGRMRYIRRCMPLMTADTPRHSSVMIYAGKYVRPNFRSDVLEEWTLQPPSYEAHDFPEDVLTPLTRSDTISSSASARSMPRADSPMQEIQLAEPRATTRKRSGQKQGEERRGGQRSMSRQRKAMQPSELEANLVLLGF